MWQRCSTRAAMARRSGIEEEDVKYKLGLAVILGLVALITGGFTVLGRNGAGSALQTTETPTALPTDSATPATTPTSTPEAVFEFEGTLLRGAGGCWGLKLDNGPVIIGPLAGDLTGYSEGERVKITGMWETAGATNPCLVTRLFRLLTITRSPLPSSAASPPTPPQALPLTGGSSMADDAGREGILTVILGISICCLLLLCATAIVWLAGRPLS